MSSAFPPTLYRFLLIWRKFYSMTVLQNHVQKASRRNSQVRIFLWKSALLVNFPITVKQQRLFQKALRQLSVPVLCCTSISIFFLVSQSKMATLCTNFCLNAMEGTRCRSCMRHCATSTPVAGSSFEGVIEIFEEVKSHPGM